MSVLILNEQRVGDSKQHCPKECGFSSCTEYKIRFQWMHGTIAITWPEGSPEDGLVMLIDAFERRMRALGYPSNTQYNAWRIFDIDCRKLREQLRWRLYFRFVASGEMTGF